MAFSLASGIVSDCFSTACLADKDVGDDSPLTRGLSSLWITSPPKYEVVVMTDTDVQAPKIEFPCERYPIKVIGDAGEGFPALVVEVMRRHVDDFDESTLVVRDSSAGRFMSVQVLITATSADQLQAIHMDLRATGRVHMVL